MEEPFGFGYGMWDFFFSDKTGILGTERFY